VVRLSESNRNHQLVILKINESSPRRAKIRDPFG
jgi:hypothetical protein